MLPPKKLLPLYTTHGDLGAFLVFPYIYNPSGEWIGWVAADRRVYSVHGHYVGMLTDELRILRKREWSASVPRRKSPPAPLPIRPPAHVPLPPQMPEVSTHMIDVLDEYPELMPAVDFGDLRQDTD
jgi:hypothetical protein